MAGKLTVEFALETACSMRCRYCYSAHTPPNPMTKQVADDFFNKIPLMLDYYDKDSYHISYFGGEPLLNWEIIEYTLPKFNNDKSCKSVIVITNGTLLDEYKVNFLKENNCGISLSFDGIWQDKNRPQEDKNGTFEWFIKNKNLIHKITDSCKVMIYPRNFKTLTENFEFFINEYQFMHPDFCLVRDNIYRQEDIEIFKIEIERLAKKIIEFQNKGINVGVGLFELYTLDILANQRFGKRDHGCFVGVSGLEYAVDGNFWPCERFRSAGKFQLSDGYNLIKENLDFLKDPKISDPKTFDECKTCEIYEFCNMGCTFSEMKEQSMQGRSPVKSVCELLKHSYKWAMWVFQNSNDEYKKYLFRRLENGG